METFMLESKIQTKIKKKLEEKGYLVIKLIKTSCNGIPDLIALKDGKTIFIEVKQPSGVLSELQKLRIKQLSDLGFECKVWIDFEVDFMLKN
jgi:Holliday junction resolvase